jgi:hypothetical protein
MRARMIACERMVALPTELLRSAREKRAWAMTIA